MSNYLRNEEAIQFVEDNQSLIATGKPWNQPQWFRHNKGSYDYDYKQCTFEEAMKAFAEGSKINCTISEFFGVENPYEGRYVTNRYTTTTQVDADRLAKLDHCPSDQIKFTPGVEPVHTGDGWTLWSDGKFTFKVYSVPEKRSSLSKDAASIISAIKGADCGSVYLEGGYSLIARIATINKEEKLIYAGTKPGGYAGQSITRFFVTLDDGTLLTFYVRSVGYSEGYQYDVYATFKAARDEFDQVQKWAAGWREHECLECGAVFSESGHVEPGQMGCDRCN